MAAGEMTRRAFLALRVIQRQGKSTSRWLVKNCGKWSRKIRYLKICEFNCPRSNFPAKIRSRPIQECIRCVCLCVIEKSVLQDRFFHGAKSRDFHEFFSFRESAQMASRKLPGCVGSVRERMRAS